MLLGLEAEGWNQMRYIQGASANDSLDIQENGQGPFRDHKRTLQWAIKN